MKLSLVERMPEALRESAITQNVARGQRLFRRGDRAGYLYLIQQGRFQEVSYPEEGRMAVLQILNAGSTLGETGLFNQVYRSTAIAQINSQVIAYPLSVLKEQLQRSPLVMETLIEILSQKIYEFQVRLEWRSISLADRRVLEYLKHQLEKVSQNRDTTTTLTLNTPLQEIAAELGFVPGTLSRALAKLEAEQTIQREDNRITLLDTDVA